jgi:hypothetical protein
MKFIPRPLVKTDPNNHAFGHKLSKLIATMRRLPEPPARPDNPAVDVWGWRSESNVPLAEKSSPARSKQRGGRAECAVWREPPGPERWKNRSRTMPGIAAEAYLLGKIAETSSDLVKGREWEEFRDACGGMEKLEAAHAEAVHAWEQWHRDSDG